MALVRPVTKTIISTTEFGHPVYDWIAANTPTAWTQLPFLNGWQNFGSGYAALRYRKIGDIVYIQGAAKGGSAPPSPGQISIGMLPAGFRPVVATINVVLFGGSDTWGGMGRLDVWSDGNVMVVASSAMPGAATMVAANFAFSTL